MIYNCYLRNGIVYVPTVAKVEAGFYLDIDPVDVVPVSDAAQLRRAFQRAIGRGNPIVPTPADRNEPFVVLKYAGIKTWSAFARGTSVWNIREKDGPWEIVARRKGPRGGFVEDRDRTVTLPGDTTIDDVIDRMIAILQAASSK